jgi:hypothetical protein
MSDFIGRYAPEKFICANIGAITGILLTGQEKWVIFSKGYIFLKNWTYKVLLRHNTSPFKGACRFIYLKYAKAALYGPHLHCHKPIPTQFRPLTYFSAVGNRTRQEVEVQNVTVSRGAKCYPRRKYLVYIFRIFDTV